MEMRVDSDDAVGFASRLSLKISLRVSDEPVIEIIYNR